MGRITSTKGTEGDTNDKNNGHGRRPRRSKSNGEGRTSPHRHAHPVRRCRTTSRHHPETAPSRMRLFQSCRHRHLSSANHRILSHRQKGASPMVPTVQQNLPEKRSTKSIPVGQRWRMDQQQVRSIPGPCSVLHRHPVHRRPVRASSKVVKGPNWSEPGHN